MNNNKNNSDIGLLSGFLFLITIIAVLFTANFHVPNSGQHTGYVTSVEQSGIIWKTWTAYIKTDAQSSQEDAYCVTDPNVISDLQSAVTERDPVSVYYSVSTFTWKWQCGNEQSIIKAVDKLPSAAVLSPSSKPNSENNNTSASGMSANPGRYGVTVTQTGGIGSQVISTTARYWEPVASAQYCSGYLWESGECFYWLKPAKNYMTTSFAGPGEINTFGGEPDWVRSGYSMQVGCNKGYKITYASSLTNNPLDTYFLNLPDMTVGMRILDQQSNSIYFVCNKSN